MLNSKMISYAKHEEEFYGVLKLINGEEVLGKAEHTLPPDCSVGNSGGSLEAIQVG